MPGRFSPAEKFIRWAEVYLQDGPELFPSLTVVRRQLAEIFSEARLAGQASNIVSSNLSKSVLLMYLCFVRLYSGKAENKIKTKIEEVGVDILRLLDLVWQLLASQQLTAPKDREQKESDLCVLLSVNMAQVDSWVNNNIKTIYYVSATLIPVLQKALLGVPLAPGQWSVHYENLNKIFVLFGAVKNYQLSRYGPRPTSPPSLPKLRFNGDAFHNVSNNFSKGFSWLMSVSEPSSATKIHSLLRRLFASSKLYDDDTVITLLKRVSAVYKKAGPMLAKRREWMIYTNLETLGGYRDPKSLIDLDAEAEAWVGTEKIYNPKMVCSREVRFALLDDLVFMSKPSPTTNFTFKEFLSDPTRFATTGSGAGLPRLNAEVRAWYDNAMTTRDIKFKSSKWAGYLASTPEELLKIGLARTKQHNKMFIKPDELTKLRSIVTGDQETLLKMAYVGYYATADLNDCDALSLFWSDEKRAVRLRAAALATKGDLWAMPIDQSAFDANVSTDMLLDAVRWLCSRAKMRMPSSEMAEVCEALVYALDGGTLEVDGGRVFEIKRGVLSGWLWTALLGSIINYLQFREISKAIGLSWADCFLPVFQGDDVAVRLRYVSDAAKLYFGYKDYGLDINPNKFFIAQDRDEFLRLVPQDGTTKGYLTRIGSGILWHRPASAMPDPVTEWKEQLDSWMRALSRSAVRDKVLRLIYGETQRIFNLSLEQAQALVHTPAAAGGGGFTPWASEWIAVSSPPDTRPRVLSVSSRLLTSLNITDQASVVTTILGSQLPAPPASSRKFTMVSVPRIDFNLRLPVFDIVEEFKNIRSLRPLWKKELNTLVREAMIQDYLNKRQDVKILDLLDNPNPIWEQRAILGRRTWIDWLKGSFIVAPRTTINPVYVKMYTDYCLDAVWTKIKKITPKTMSILIEIATHRSISITNTFIGY